MLCTKSQEINKVGGTEVGTLMDTRKVIRIKATASSNAKLDNTLSTASYSQK